MASDSADVHAGLAKLDAEITRLKDRLDELTKARAQLKTQADRQAVRGAIASEGIVGALRYWLEKHERDGADLYWHMHEWVREVNPLLTWMTASRTPTVVQIMYWVEPDTTARDVEALSHALTQWGREIDTARRGDARLPHLQVSFVHGDERLTQLKVQRVSVVLAQHDDGWALVAPAPSSAWIDTSGADCLPLVKRARAMTLARGRWLP